MKNKHRIVDSGRGILWDGGPYYSLKDAKLAAENIATKNCESKDMYYAYWDEYYYIVAKSCR